MNKTQHLKFSLAFLFVLVASHLQAISLYPDSTQIKLIYQQDSNAFYLHFDNQNFVWDNEYFNDIVEGYTLIGYNATPALQYHFSPHFKIQAGAYFLKYSGVDSYTKVLPNYAAIYHKNRMSFTLGSLYGGFYHRLSDIEYNIERSFTANAENGVQLRLDRERLFLDVWLDWQSYIFTGEDKQEELLAGISLQPVLWSNAQTVLRLPAHALVKHMGGQINSGDHNMLTALNYGLGLEVNHSFKQGLYQLNMQLAYKGYTDNSPADLVVDTTLDQWIYEQGWGLSSTLRLSRKQSFIAVGHWYADQYLSLAGNRMYQCASEKSAEQHQQTRELLTAQLYLAKAICDGVNLGFMGEAYYDYGQSLFDFTIGAKLSIDANFKLRIAHR